jgi:BASS family bile acid:Na+ symporter
MDSALTSVGLPIALAVIMFGLGLGLTVADFRRVGKHPRAVVVALTCQLALLPAVCFGLVKLFDLDPLLAIGMLLLAASPGGTTANLYSHLFRGDVALNITLTAVNSILSIATLPLIVNFAIDHFDEGDSVSMPLPEVLKVFVLILVPVGIGMMVRASRPAFARSMGRPVRVASIVILTVLVIAILASERDTVGGSFADVGVVAGLFCAISLVVGYYVPRAFGVAEDQAIASSMEIGVHNATLAIFVAENVLDNNEVAVPAAVYSLLMFVLALAWGTVITRWIRQAPVSRAAT